jgi:hypothetical protein
MSKKTTNRPFIKIDTQEMRSWLPEVSAGELKTWFAYKLRANSNGEAWMTLKTLAADTGLEPTTVSRHRNSLVRRGALISVNDGHRAKAGSFAPPRFRVEIPIRSGTAEQPHGEIAARHDSIQPHGNIGQSRTAILEYQEVKREVETSQVEGADAPRQFEILKLPDLRFDVLRKVYLTDFEKKSPNLKAPFDASDGRTLKNLLNRQPAATADELVAWLKNAFASDDVPPLRPMFRLREFCAHAEKFAQGPLLKRAGGPIPIRSAKSDPAEAARLASLVE